MSNPELAIYAVHAAFWCTFGLARLAVRLRDRKTSRSPVDVPVSRTPITARFSRALVALHGVAFGVMYFGIGNSVLPARVPVLFRGQALVGTAVIAGGAALVATALLAFQSWRFRASLDSSHRLATGGPFRVLRHPIYMGLNLLALGSAIWLPTPIMGLACVLMVVGSDLRARTEEGLLLQAFGADYREYCTRTWRFIPGVY
jgi:protein-S-isoprenylcysteine O-methyltransferase Ste14